MPKFNPDKFATEIRAARDRRESIVKKDRRNLDGALIEDPVKREILLLNIILAAVDAATEEQEDLYQEFTKGT